jgi:transposase-like protein
MVKEKLVELYWKEGKSIKMIAQEIGMSTSSLKRLFDSYQIQRRPFSTKGLHLNIGRKASEETRKNISNSMKGRVLSPEHREKVIRTLRPGGKLSENGSWKGGITKQGGYVLVKIPGHPHSWENGYVKRAILVAEAKIGRPLAPNEITHHINHVKEDDRPENIEVLTSSEHTTLHNEIKALAKESELESRLSKGE